ncbi:MAG: DUF2851 family protein, partial [Chloroflexi bacterium]|nr:DUF2851 family protein [Chloroflexota bacterium]
MNKVKIIQGLNQKTASYKVSEVIVAFIWEKQLFSSPDLYCIYPGRKNNDSGPDFKDAVLINSSGKTLSGDIEIHVKASDWYSHGHHRDPAYNKVVLHITLWEDNIKKILLQNGAVIPNFSLYPVLTHSWDKILYHYKNNQEMQHRCLIQPHSTPDIILNAGEQRFQLKVEAFRKRLNNENSSQVIYSGIMRALGYSKNKEQFELLSKSIPLTILKNNTQGFQPDLQLLILEA